MADLAAIEDVRLPDSDENEVRLGDLWRTNPWSSRGSATTAERSAGSTSRSCVTGTSEFEAKGADVGGHRDGLAGDGRQLQGRAAHPVPAARGPRQGDLPRPGDEAVGSAWNIYGPPVWIKGIQVDPRPRATGSRSKIHCSSVAWSSSTRAARSSTVHAIGVVRTSPRSDDVIAALP